MDLDKLKKVLLERTGKKNTIIDKGEDGIRVVYVQGEKPELQPCLDLRDETQAIATAEGYNLNVEVRVVSWAQI